MTNEIQEPQHEEQQGAASAIPDAPAAAQRRSVPGMETLTAAREAADFVSRLFADNSPTDASGAQDAQAQAGEMPEMQEELQTASQPQQGVDGMFAPPSLAGQHVLVLGLGASGLAMARWCARVGARVTVADTRERPPQLDVLRTELPQVEFVAGEFQAVLVEGRAGEPSDVRAVFKSPGLSPTQAAAAWQAAERLGLWRGGELDLFLHALQTLRAERDYAPKLLAITGTNGKTTVTSLAGMLMKQVDEWNVAVAGNIGPSMLDVLGERLDAEQGGGTALPDVWVLELSSFQLDGVRDFEPTAAVLLNLTQDHLDWHGEMQAYGAAKARVFGKKGLRIYNRDDAEAVRLATALPPGKKAKMPETVSFGLDAPQRPGDYGIETVNGMTWLVRAQPTDETQKRGRDAARDEDLFIQRLLPADALRIRGRHNAVNALAALALAQAAGCPLGPLLFGLREYRGEPHRVESVAVVREVEYFDDSKGTNVGATVAAINGLGDADSAPGTDGAGRKLVVILGGDGKGQDFAPLAEPVRRYARAVVLIGRDAAQIRAAIEDDARAAGITLIDAATLPEAVKLASEQARSGDAVLLSPACASLDMFENYRHRAHVFVEAVQALSEEGGLA